MRIWLAAIAATLIQPLVLLACMAHDLIRSSDPVHGLGFFLSSVLVVGGAGVLLLGIPAFLLLHRFGRANWMSLSVAGFVLAALPVAALSWPSSRAGFSAGQSWHGEYIRTYVDGEPTHHAWLVFAEDVLRMGLHGLAGALVFYAVWSRLDARGRLAARAA